MLTTLLSLFWFLTRTTLFVTGSSPGTRRRDAKRKNGVPVKKKCRKARLPARRLRSRNWCITVFEQDFEDEDGDGFRIPDDHPNFKYAVYQMEATPKNGKLHYQLYAEFKEHVTMRWIKKHFNCPGAHCEPKSGNSTRAQAREYCMKKSTRAHGFGPYEYGKWTGQGARTDIESMAMMAYEKVPNKVIFLEHPGSYARYYKSVQHLKRLDAIDEPSRDTDLHVFLFYGKPGTGKTRAVYDYARAKSVPLWTLPVKAGQNMWFDGYIGQKYVLLDDFSGKMPLDQLLRLLDRYPVQVEVKGDHSWWCPDAIFITTNVHPKDWYDYSQRADSREALKRRFHMVFDFNSKDVTGMPKACLMGDWWSSFDDIMQDGWNNTIVPGVKFDHPISTEGLIYGPVSLPSVLSSITSPTLMPDEITQHQPDVEIIASASPFLNDGRDSTDAVVLSDQLPKELPEKRPLKAEDEDEFEMEPPSPNIMDDHTAWTHLAKSRLEEASSGPRYVDDPSEDDPSTEVEKSGSDDDEGGDVLDGGPDPSSQDRSYDPENEEHEALLRELENPVFGWLPKKPK